MPAELFLIIISRRSSHYVTHAFAVLGRYVNQSSSHYYFFLFFGPCQMRTVIISAARPSHNDERALHEVVLGPIILLTLHPTSST